MPYYEYITEQRIKIFWSKVNKHGGTPSCRPELGPCWLWTASRKLGYGRMVFDSINILAHRLAYELLVGPIPSDLQLDHLCRVRHCVNPAHLEPVTRHINILRGEGVSARNARKTHCQNGHPFNQSTTLFYRGTRRCRVCRRYWMRQYRARLSTS